MCCRWELGQITFLERASDVQAVATELLERVESDKSEVPVNGHASPNGNGYHTVANDTTIVNPPTSYIQPISTASLDEALDPQNAGQIGTVAATKILPSEPSMKEPKEEPKPTPSSIGAVSAEAQNADIARQAAEAKASAERRATRSAAGTPYKAVGDSKWAKIKGYSTFQVGQIALHDLMLLTHGM